MALPQAAVASAEAATASAAKQVRNPVSAPCANGLVVELVQCIRSRDLRNVRRIHAQAIEFGLLSDERVSSYLINMYAQCGSMVEAKEVFDATADASSLCWSSLMFGYVTNEQYHLCMEVFEQMQEEASRISDTRPFNAALKACGASVSKQGSGGKARKWKWLEKAKAVHSSALMSFPPDVFLENMLVGVYASCGQMVHSRSVFDNMAERNEPSWSLLINGYLENGDWILALKLFDSMDQVGAGSLRGSRTYVAALRAAQAAVEKDGYGKWVEKLKSIHSQALMDGCCNSFVENMLLTIYVENGTMACARTHFDNMANRDQISWNILLRGYAENGRHRLMLDLLDRMEGEGHVLDERSYLAALTACISGGDQCLEKGKAIHSRAVMNGCFNCILGNKLIDMYNKSGNVGHARTVFDTMEDRSVISWNTMLSGYVDNGRGDLALELFDAMEGDCVPDPNPLTFVAILGAYAALVSENVDYHGVSISKGREWLEKGKALHSAAVINNCYEPFVQGALINLYARAGNMVHAQAVFDKADKSTIVPWNCLIQGYAINGQSEVALDLLSQLQTRGIAFDKSTYATALLACANTMAVEPGKAFHAQIKEEGMEQDLKVATSLVDFYGKCGNMAPAKQIFDAIPVKDTVAWNSLICNYGLKGDTKQVFELFQKMREQGVSPNDVTFQCVLTACSHAGLTDEARLHFDSMAKEYKINPNARHYCCMVDVLCRSNCVEEALELVKGMPLKPSAAIWNTLLDAGRKRNNPVVGKVAYEGLLALDRNVETAYVLMAQCQGDLPQTPIRESSLPGSGAGAWKICSTNMNSEGITWWTDETSKVHKFVAGGKLHEEDHIAQKKLFELHRQLRELGYVENVNTEK